VVREMTSETAGSPESLFETYGSVLLDTVNIVSFYKWLLLNRKYGGLMRRV
jgi:hypothetical protein